MSLRIVEIAPGLMRLPPTGFGAIERVIWELRLEFEKAGHSVVIINGLDAKNAEAVSDMQKAGYVVHTHWHDHSLMLKGYGVPHAHTSHSHVWFRDSVQAIHAADVYLALHDGMIPDGYQGHVQVVGNGVNPETWVNRSENRENIVVSCANYSKRKRLEMMYELVDLLPADWQGIIVGPGVPESLLPNPRITLLGEQTERQLVDLYNRCKVGFHPAKHEAFALVPMEMAACGLHTYVATESYIYGFPVAEFGHIGDAAADISRGCDYTPDQVSTLTSKKFGWESVAKRATDGLSRLNKEVANAGNKS